MGGQGRDGDPMTTLTDHIATAREVAIDLRGEEMGMREEARRAARANHGSQAYSLRDEATDLARRAAAIEALIAIAERANG